MDEQVTFVDTGRAPPRSQQPWPTVLVKRARIDAEIERLADLSLDPGQQRAVAVNHPMNRGPVPAFSPATDVTITVLRSGEVSPPLRTNASAVDLCLRGQAEAEIGPKRLALTQFDVWNTPAMNTVQYRNTGKELFVRLSYSNRPLLEHLEVMHVDLTPGNASAGVAPAGDAQTPRARDAAVPIPVGTDGADLRGYEWLVDIEAVESKPLLWPWREVETRLGNVYGMDLAYTGRHLYLLYNPSTGRLMGTTPFHFATMAKFPPGKIDRPHRHTSASINYYLWGHGKSTVAGQRVEWEAGDLQFSAPGWAVHNHGSREQGFVALTIQDHPLHLAMESLLWQEELKGPIQQLGTSSGFDTNLLWQEELKGPIQQLGTSSGFDTNLTGVTGGAR